MTDGISTLTRRLPMRTTLFPYTTLFRSFLSAGNIVLNANGLTDAGAVTMTASGTGAITTNGPLATTGNRNINLTTTKIGRATCRERQQKTVDSVTLTMEGAITGSLPLNHAATSPS